MTGAVKGQFLSAYLDEVVKQPFTVYHPGFYWDEAPEDHDPIPDASAAPHLPSSSSLPSISRSPNMPGLKRNPSKP